MRRSCLLTIAFALFFCGNATSQQSFLVVHDDRNDPCREFKMRILMPAGMANLKQSVKTAPDNLDSGMVWNPCPQDAQLFASVTPTNLIPIETTPAIRPDLRSDFFTRPPTKVLFPFLDNGQKRKMDFFRTGLPPTFDSMQWLTQGVRSSSSRGPQSNKLD